MKTTGVRSRAELIRVVEKSPVAAAVVVAAVAQCPEAVVVVVVSIALSTV